MIMRLRIIFNQAIKWVDSADFSVCVAPYILHKHGTDLGQIDCTTLFEKSPFQNFGLKTCVFILWIFEK